jgi:hypothetical protein
MGLTQFKGRKEWLHIFLECCGICHRTICCEESDASSQIMEREVAEGPNQRIL